MGKTDRTTTEAIMRLARFTTRRLMVLVAIVAVGCGVELVRERRRAFDIKLNECASIAILSEGNARYCAANARSFVDRGDPEAAAKWFRLGALYRAREVAHGRLRDKYERAAR